MQGMQLTFWPRYPDLNLGYFDHLLQKNAQELIFTRKIAETVSKITSSPVLTLHNATMGAPGGWGIYDFKTQLGEIYPQWKEKVNALWLELTPKLREKILPIINIWLKRMIRTTSLKARYFQEKQRLSIFLPLLIAILKTSESFLQSSASFLVIPYIDKFIASSFGDKDIGYFKEFLKFVLFFAPKTIVLCFDETTHPQGPTLKLAISALNKEKKWIKGLGVYGTGEIVTAETVTKLIPKYQVFVISAYQGKSRPYGWYEIRTYCPQEYHPAWRDGLTELFSGTQVGFLSQNEKKDQVQTEKGKILLGTYFRLKLKEYSLTPLSGEPFWCFYEILGNLG